MLLERLGDQRLAAVRCRQLFSRERAYECERNAAAFQNVSDGLYGSVEKADIQQGRVELLMERNWKSCDRRHGGSDDNALHLDQDVDDIHGEESFVFNDEHSRPTMFRSISHRQRRGWFSV